MSATNYAGPVTTTAPSASAGSTQPGTPEHWVLTLSCPDRAGIVHAVAGALAEHGGNITESQQFGDAETQLFFMRVQVESTASREEPSSRLSSRSRRPSRCRGASTWSGARCAPSCW